MPKTIFEFVKQEETAFVLPITVVDGWEWNMKEHIRLTTLYKNSQFSNGNDTVSRDDKPFKNIVRPILDLQYRTEGFDVKDIVLYVDNEDYYFKSFLTERYHGRWAVQNEMDTFIDDVVESYADYGGALIKDIDKKKPEIVPLPSIAFCDQTNMLGSPFGLKHFYGPDELMAFEGQGWGDKKNGATCTLEEAIILSETNKVPDAQTGKQNQTPGKYVEVYEVHGMMPAHWLPNDSKKKTKFVRQMQIVMFYVDQNGKKQGLTLYAGREKDGLFKQLIRNKIFGRALGMGGVEELFDAQVWTNYSEIVKKGMLDAAMKTILKTTDPTIKGKHPRGLKNLENLEIIEVEDGKDITKIDTSPTNYALFEKMTNDWEIHAQMLGAANDAILGENPPAGTPFKLQNLITNEARGLHDYRRGKVATFIEVVYRDWVLPDIQKDISNGAKFLQELSLDELHQVSDALVICQSNYYIKEMILAGEDVTPVKVEAARQKIRTEFMKKGSKHFLEIFKNEMDNLPLDVRIDVVSKQKDLDKITDKLVNIFRQIIAAPQILDDPRMAKLFNKIIEASGLSPIDFGMAIPKPAAPAPQTAPANVVQPPAPTAVIPTSAPVAV